MTWNFALLAVDQLVNSAAKMRYMSNGQVGVPAVFRGPGGSALQLAAQHSQAFESWYAHVPGLKVVMPATPADAKGLLKSAIRDDDPVIFIEGEMLYNTKGEVPEGEHVVPIGQADVKREGGDVTIDLPLQDGQRRAQGGRAARRRWGRRRGGRPAHDPAPGHRNGLASVAKTHRCVVVEEGWPFAGVGAQVVDTIQREAFDELDAPDPPGYRRRRPHAVQQALERAAKADPAKVVGGGQSGLYRE